MLALYRSVVAVAFVLFQTCSLVEACVPHATNTSRVYCASLGYNRTARVSYQDQKDAALQFVQFVPLIQIGCSANSKVFFCSFYFPMCHPLRTNEGIPPCRSLCLDVKSGCEPLMNKFGFLWPDVMKCTSFPKFGSRGLCVAPNTLTSTSKNTTMNTENNKNNTITITAGNTTALPITDEPTTNAIARSTTEEPTASKFIKSLHFITVCTEFKAYATVI